jgi:hypothetical protein
MINATRHAFCADSITANAFLINKGTTNVPIVASVTFLVCSNSMASICVPCAMISIILYRSTHPSGYFVGQGSRTDINRKRKLICPVSNIQPQASPTSAVLYSANTSPPKWIRIFVSPERTSRRTQAASIAYMFPQFLHPANTPTIHRHSLNVRQRRMKLENTLLSVTLPAEFSSKAMEYNMLYQKDVVLVCDGGIDHQVPLCPPPTKVIIIICCCHCFLILCLLTQY